MKYIEYPNREEWLKGRINSIGASEVASVLGVGFLSALELWKIKTKATTPKDLSDNPRVKYGSDAEEHLRALFALKNNDKYIVSYNPYRVYFHEQYEFLSCTLDGELTKISDSTKGVWECKTVFINSKKQLDEWDGRLPDRYYVQVLEQLSITGYKFAILTVELVYPEGNSEIRNFEIDRDEQVENDIEYVRNEVVEVWQKYVKTGKQPPTKISL